MAHYKAELAARCFTALDQQGNCPITVKKQAENNFDGAQYLFSSKQANWFDAAIDCF
jgi:hypothetical protein